MTNELLNAAKDRAAQELGYKNFGDVIMEEGELNTVIDRAMEIYAEGVSGEFSEWLQKNRWYSFIDGMWHYTFEHGTSISREEYNKKYRKTTQELFNQFKNTKP